MHKYVDAFKENAVDGELLLTLTVRDLELYLSVHDKFDIEKLRREIDDMRSACNFAPADICTNSADGVGAAKDGKRSDDPLSWTSQDVCEWLRNDCGYPQYCDAFHRNQVDGDLLVGITKEELGELGVKAASHVDSILFMVKDLRRRAGGTDTSAIAHDEGPTVDDIDDFFRQDIEMEMTRGGSEF